MENRRAVPRSVPATMKRWFAERTAIVPRSPTLAVGSFQDRWPLLGDRGREGSPTLAVGSLRLVGWIEIDRPNFAYAESERPPIILNTRSGKRWGSANPDEVVRGQLA